MRNLLLKNWRLVVLQILFLVTLILDIADIFADFSAMWWLNQIISIAAIVGITVFCTLIQSD